MNKEISDMTVNIDELSETLNVLLHQVSDGLTVLVKDAQDKEITYLVEPKYFKKLSEDKSELVERNRTLSQNLKKHIRENNCKLPNPNQLTDAQKSLIQIKNKLPFFSSCSDMELISVVNNVRILKLDPEEKVFLQSETTKNIYYVVKGSIDIYKQLGESRKGKLLGTIKAKDFFGEMSFITGEPRTATAQVSKNSPTILVSFEIIENVESNKEYIFTRIYHNFLKSLSKKLTNTIY